MIDATKITNYNLSYDELQEYILFWILAAGKNGTRAANIINKWIFDVKKNEYIFDTLKNYSLGSLVRLCTKYSTGCQCNKARSIYEIVHSNIDLTTCTPDDLEKIYGIGMKTSRCFIIHTRENAPYAGLDTHILKFLSKLELDIPVPKSTPARKIYLQLEQIVLKLAKEFNMSPADFDLMIWNTYRSI
jgi:thermostable 8-oxoguanine DNA glycosylase